MQALLVYFPLSVSKGEVEELLDEFTEDPHCRMALLGTDDTGVLLITAWSEDVAAEVQEGLGRTLGPEVTIRRLALAEPAGLADDLPPLRE